MESKNVLDDSIASLGATSLIQRNIYTDVAGPLWAEIAGAPAPAPPALGQWSSPLCALCSDPDSCRESFLCMPCSLSRQLNKLNHGKAEIDWFVCVAVFAGDVITVVGIPSFALAWQVRRILRQRYSIEEHCCNAIPACTNSLDIPTAFFCRCCSLQQTLQYMRAVNQFPGGTCYYSSYGPLTAFMK